MRNPKLNKKVLICLLGIATSALGQSDITIEDLRTSSPPAFSIIGIEPKTISRPTTPRAVAAGIASSVDDSGIKPDVSMEIAPYWLSKKKRLTFDNYLSPDAGQSFLQTLSISVATKQNETPDKSSKLGIGFRFQLLPGRASVESAALIDKASLELLFAAILNSAKSNAMITTRDDIKNHASSLITNIKGGSVALGTIGSLTNPQIVVLLFDASLDIQGTLLKLISQTEILNGETINDYIDRLKADFLGSALALKIQHSLKSRVGWILEIAGANGSSLPENKFKGSKNEKAGLWANLTYRSKNQRNDFALLLRYSKAFQDSTISNQDIGLSYGYSVKYLSISAEAVFRRFQYEFPGTSLDNRPITILEKSSTYRLAVNFDYRLSDTISLSATVGKNYKNEFFSKSDFLGLFGLNFSVPTNKTLN